MTKLKLIIMLCVAITLIGVAACGGDDSQGFTEPPWSFEAIIEGREWISDNAAIIGSEDGFSFYAVTKFNFRDEDRLSIGYGGVGMANEILGGGIFDHNTDGFMVASNIQLNDLFSSGQTTWLDDEINLYSLEITDVEVIDERTYLSGRLAVQPCDFSHRPACLTIVAQFVNLPVMESYEDARWLFLDRIASRNKN